MIILVIANFNISMAAPSKGTSDEGSSQQQPQQPQQPETPTKKPSSSDDKVHPAYYYPKVVDDSEITTLTSNVGIILGIIRNINVVVAVIVLMIIGVKFIIGSVEQRATYKEQMKPYIIGVLLAASGTTLVSYIYNVFYLR